MGCQRVLSAHSNPHSGDPGEDAGTAVWACWAMSQKVMPQSRAIGQTSSIGVKRDRS